MPYVGDAIYKESIIDLRPIWGSSDDIFLAYKNVISEKILDLPTHTVVLHKHCKLDRSTAFGEFILDRFHQSKILIANYCQKIETSNNLNFGNSWSSDQGGVLICGWETHFK